MKRSTKRTHCALRFGGWTTPVNAFNRSGGAAQNFSGVKVAGNVAADEVMDGAECG